MLHNVESMLADEDQSYLLGSDHNFIIINANIKAAADRAMNQPINMRKWNISNNTNRKKYQPSILDCFTN